MPPDSTRVDLELEDPQPRRPEACPVEDWLRFLGHRWNALILWHLSRRDLRFRELAGRLPGVTAKVLSERLDGLQERGLVTRTVSHSYPRQVRYGLSDQGAAMVCVLDGLERLARARPTA